MKNIFLLIGLLFSSVFAYAQNEKQFLDKVLANDLEGASAYFDDYVDVCIGDFEDMLSKREASKKLNNFFDANKAISYSTKHQGKSKGHKSSYFVSDLKTSTGPYRFFVYFNESDKISEIRLEKK